MSEKISSLSPSQCEAFSDRLRGSTSDATMPSSNPPFTGHQIQLFMAYISLFIKWNKAYNLSAIREPSDIFVKHLLDSLSICSLIKGERFIDVGTGGGLPGIPLAICFPEKHFTLLDSAGKKMRFLHAVKSELKLTNVDIQNTRVESYEPPKLFDGVISRAFASLEDMLNLCTHLLEPNGRFFAMKGVVPQNEINTLDEGFKHIQTHVIQVEGLDAERCLVEIALAGSTISQA